MNQKVLICDDTAFMRKMLSDILVEKGFEVIGEAENGKVAIEKYNVLKPDVTLMDITMPELDGLQALNGIMKINPSAKVVMCSAMGQEGIVVEAIKGGAKDFIVKPFERSRVIEALERVIAN